MTQKTEEPLSRRAPEERRARIVGAAEALMTTKGFEATSISDVARAAGVAVGTVYLYFPDKASLRFGVVNARKSRIAAFIDRQRVVETGSLHARVTALIEPLMEMILREPPLSPAYDRARLEAMGPDALRAFAAVDDAILRFLDGLHEAGLARAPDRGVAALMASGLVMGAVDACRRGESDLPAASAEVIAALTRWWSLEGDRRGSPA